MFLAEEGCVEVKVAKQGGIGTMNCLMCTVHEHVRVLINKPKGLKRLGNCDQLTESIIHGAFLQGVKELLLRVLYMSAQNLLQCFILCEVCLLLFLRKV